jgi:hypothetical protein
MILKMRESKEKYEKKYLTMSFIDNCEYLCGSQRKHTCLGQLKVKPCLIDDV